MKKTFLILFLPLLVNAQTDTIKKAVAWQNTYMGVTTMYGLTADSTPYTFGFNLRFDASGNPLMAEVVRNDLAQHTTDYQVLNNCVSAASMLWNYCMDDSGNVYTGFNYTRTIYQFNFKHGIVATDLGCGFGNGQWHGLAYTIRMGTDHHIYFGSSSGALTWAEFDPATNQWVNRPQYEIDNLNDYVLDIVGTTDWVYTQIGQRNNTVRLMATEKATGISHELFHIPASSRFQLESRTGGCYVSEGSIGTYKLENGQATWISWSRNAWPQNSGTRVDKYEIGDVGQTKVKSFYDVYNNKLFASVSMWGQPYPPYQEYPIVNAAKQRNQIKLIFFDSTDTSSIYYVGNYYGIWFKYSSIGDSATALGSTAYNIYTVQQINDSLFIWSGYTDGSVGIWNKNKKWTSVTYNPNGASSSTSDTTNPSLFWRFRTMTAGQFHWASLSVRMNDSVFVYAGNVQRTNSTASIGSLNWKYRDHIRAYDCNKMPVGISAVSIAKWHDLAILSTSGNSNAKIYFYNPQTNQMADSIQLSGYTNYGNIFVHDDTLIGINNQNQCYKINLVTRQQFYQQFIGLYNVNQLEHGYIGLNGSPTPPGNYWIRLIGIYNAYPFNENVYSITWSLYNITRTRNLYPAPPQPEQHLISEKTFLIYPTVTHGIVHIQGEGKYYVRDMQGRLLQIKNGSGDVDLSNYNAGVYFINNKKVIKL